MQENMVNPLSSHEKFPIWNYSRHTTLNMSDPRSQAVSGLVCTWMVKRLFDTRCFEFLWSFSLVRGGVVAQRLEMNGEAPTSAFHPHLPHFSKIRNLPAAPCAP